MHTNIPRNLIMRVKKKYHGIHEFEIFSCYFASHRPFFTSNMAVYDLSATNSCDFYSTSESYIQRLLSA